MKRLVLSLLVVAGLELCWSAFYCADTGFYYSDKTFCDNACFSSCQTLSDNPQGLACDTANYELFIYNPQTNKTIAITKNADFWDQFSDLLVIEDASDNEAGKEILSYLNTSAWIGMYDPNYSSSYNSVNPDRFVWWDGTQVGYTNWASGEPDNAVLTEDIGVVSPPGEHWAFMETDGKWRDDGLHASRGGDYKPRYRALVMWRKQLDCVNGLSQSDQTTTTDMVNLYCNGETPCFLCTDGNDIQRCSLGTAFAGTVQINGGEISLSYPLKGKVKVFASGTIDYCGGRCSLSDGDALKSWVVFKGDDGKLYWLGNPNRSPVCLGSLSLNVLSYTENSDGSITFTVPSGVKFVSVGDVESFSGRCTGDNSFSFSLTFYTGRKEWLCPIQNNCQCPDGGTWDNDLKKCIKEPSYTCTSSSYSFDNTSKLCISSPLCRGGTYDSADNRCEAPPVPVCPSGTTYDPSLDLCYTSYTCPSGYALDPADDRCETPASVSCSKGTFNQSSGMCEFSPECPPGSTFVDGRCEKAPEVACGLGAYDPTDNRFEWSPSCPAGMTFNSAKDRCEYAPSCPSGNIGSSGMCEAQVNWICPPGYTYDPANHQCVYVEQIPATPNCPAGYTYDGAKKMCVASPEWQCRLEKGGCVDPPQQFSCTGGNCSAGGFNFGANCEVDPGCGVINLGESCRDEQCSFTNLSVQVCPDGSLSSVCEVAPSYSCPDGYTLNLDICEKTYTEPSVPSCLEGYIYDETYEVCLGSPDCGSGQYDNADTVCWVGVADTGCGNANYDASQNVCWTTFFFTCEEGYTFDPDKRVCYTLPTCPEGILAGGVCRIAPDTNCGGNSFDASQMVCYSSPQCGGLFKYSPARNRCEKSADRSCSVGTYDPTQDVCFFLPSCEDSGTFNAGADRCEMSPQMGCNSPFVLDQDMCTADRICQGKTACVISEACPSGGTFDASSGVCYVSATPVCPSGGSYDPSAGKCYSSLLTWQVKTKDVFNGWYGLWHECGIRIDVEGITYWGCTVSETLTIPAGSRIHLKWSVSYNCDDDHGWFSFTSNTEYFYHKGTCLLPSSGDEVITQNFSGGVFGYQAEYYDTRWDLVHVWIEWTEPSCPPQYSPDLGTGKCVSSPSDYLCPSPYIYNPSTKRCEAPLNVDMTCPLDPSLPCVQDTDGGYYCSDKQCLDATTFPPTNNDTQQGRNDIPADGTVDKNGCAGTVYIFNGRDMRCRPPGTQTGFSNCCKKTRTWFGLGSCNETEKQLASLRSWGRLDGNCHYVGEYCTEYWGPDCCKVCVQKKKTYCCFSSPLARIIHEQGRPQLGIGWGTPESPNCRGFTAQEFQKLDFSKIDFSEWIEEEVRKNIAPAVQQNINNVINQLPSQIQVE